MRNAIIEQDLKFIIDSDVPWQAMEGKNILISGANGFLANYLVETILFLNENKFKNKAKVFALDRNKDRFESYKNRNDFMPIVQDICQPIEIKDEIHFIIHTASQASPKYYGKDPVGTLSANILGTKNLLDLAREKKVESFLFFSAGLVYGEFAEKDVKIKENTFGSLDPTDVASCYGESKRMAETMCACWLHQYGVPTKIVRPAHTYGPGVRLDDGRVYADFVSDIINNRNITMKSDGKAVRTFCYIADATVAFFLVLLKGENGKAYNVADNKGETSILDLANLLAGLFPEKNLKVERKEIFQEGYIKSKIERHFLDTSRIIGLGWEPKHSLEQGFARIIKSYETI
ncbi:MAG: NAD-dependent epimerase/dehydratase family protein [Patescibacteria group bacterium]